MFSSPPVNHLAQAMPSLVSSTRSYGFENRTPRKRTTASQNHSGSSIERATSSGKSRSPSLAMKRATLLEASNSASGRFFFQAEDGIRDADVTGVQTCALPI